MPMKSADEIVRRAWARGLRPPPDLTVSEWADRNYFLPPSSPEPGLWRTDRTPYLREIMDGLSPKSPVDSIAVMKGSQVGVTVGPGGAFIGYCIDQCPAETLIVLPDMKTTKTWVKRKLNPVLRYSPCLQGKVSDPRERDGGNTQFLKEFGNGAAMVITWSSSAAGLKSISARNLIFDEVDSFALDADGEGDPITLAERRSTNFPRRKSLKMSTPSEDEKSRIEAEYRRGDQRHYFVACPHCGHRQVLIFDQFRFEPQTEKPEEVKSAWFDCVACAERIDEWHKDRMLAIGEWFATRDRKELIEHGFEASEFTAMLAEKRASQETVLSYHLPTFYAPLGWEGSSWLAIARDYVKARPYPQEMKTFTTHILGQTYKERGQTSDWRRLYDRRERYTLGTVPRGGLILTAGFDVQGDRIEGGVWAWGRGRQCWLVDYIQLAGKTTEQDVWNRLDQYIHAVYPREDGAMIPLHRVAIDSGAFTTQVYSWIRRHPAGRIMATKGWDNGDRMCWMGNAIDIKHNGQKQRIGHHLWHVWTTLIKDELFSRLSLDPPTEEEKHDGAGYPPMYLHIPEMPEDFFRQLTAETKVKGEYKKTEHDRNEVLDTWVYARAAAYLSQVDAFDRPGSVGWDNMDRLALNSVPAEVVTAPGPMQRQAVVKPPTPQPAVARNQDGGGAWIDRGRRRGGWLEG